MQTTLNVVPTPRQTRRSETGRPRSGDNLRRREPTDPKKRFRPKKARRCIRVFRRNRCGSRLGLRSPEVLHLRPRSRLLHLVRRSCMRPRQPLLAPRRRHQTLRHRRLYLLPSLALHRVLNNLPTQRTLSRPATVLPPFTVMRIRVSLKVRSRRKERTRCGTVQLACTIQRRRRSQALILAPLGSIRSVETPREEEEVTVRCSLHLRVGVMRTPRCRRRCLHRSPITISTIKTSSSSPSSSRRTRGIKPTRCRSATFDALLRNRLNCSILIDHPVG